MEIKSKFQKFDCKSMQVGSINGVKPNIELIAQKFNVSIATISRALRDLPGVRSELRAEIKAMAKDLGVKSRAERKVDTSSVILPARSMTLGVLVCASDRNDFPEAYLRGIGRMCFDLGITPCVHLVPADQMPRMVEPEKVLPSIRDRMFTEAILIHRWPNPVVDALSSVLHCVAIVNRPSNPKVDHVTIDHDGGMQAICDYLISFGHIRIGYFGHSSEFQWARQRTSGFISAMDHHGHAVPRERQLAVESDALIGQPVSWGLDIDRLVPETLAGVTAWVCPNGCAADKAIEILQSAGFKIPEMVSVIAFDGHESRFQDITGLILPTIELGEMAVRLVRDRITNNFRPAVSLVAPCGGVSQGWTTGPASRQSIS